MKKLTFSIVVVCLNAGESLRKTVDSILFQTFSDYEIIIKDGLSVDDSLTKLPKDERIRIFEKADTGIYDAMNQAVEKAEGEYIFFLNCGDVFYDKRVLEVVSGQIAEYMGKRPAIFYGDIFERLTAQRVSSNPHMDAFGCYRNVPCHQACFYAGTLMEQKQFDTGYRVRADYEHFLWCYFMGNAETIYMKLMIADYEGGGFSETKENRRKSAREHREIVSKYMSAVQIVKYKAIMFVTLSWLRSWAAGNSVTAGVYNRLKSRWYQK